MTDRELVFPVTSAWEERGAVGYLRYRSGREGRLAPPHRSGHRRQKQAAVAGAARGGPAPPPLDGARTLAVSPAPAAGGAQAAALPGAAEAPPEPGSVSPGAVESCSYGFVGGDVMNGAGCEERRSLAHF